MYCNPLLVSEHFIRMKIAEGMTNVVKEQAIYLTTESYWKREKSVLDKYIDRELLDTTDEITSDWSIHTKKLHTNDRKLDDMCHNINGK